MKNRKFWLTIVLVAFAVLIAALAFALAWKARLTDGFVSIATTGVLAVAFGTVGFQGANTLITRAAINKGTDPPTEETP